MIMKDIIPKIIHQTWKTKNLPENLKFCVNSWKKYNPEYTYMFWSDKDIDIFIREKYPQYIDIYSKLTQGIQIADLFRILILHYYGGIYVDIDFECLRPIDFWNMNYSKINIAFEPKEHHKIDVLCNALIISPKNIDTLLEIIEHGKRIIKKNNREVMNLFGPIAWTNVLYQNQDINILDRNLIYPIPDITANKTLENKYLNKILTRNFNNSWAVHYWHHSNWSRHNILDKYYFRLRYPGGNNHPDLNLPINLSNIKIEADIWVCSHGGCGSNFLVKNLEKNGYKIRTSLYHKILCHSPIQIKTNKPIVYLYRNIQDAWFSMLNRGTGIYDVNIQKLSNDKNAKISEENLLRLMINQFKNWTKNIGNNILYLSYNDIFTEKGNILLKKFLHNKDIKKFNFNANSKKYIFPEHLYQKYKNDIDYINLFESHIPKSDYII